MATFDPNGLRWEVLWSKAGDAVAVESTEPTLTCVCGQRFVDGSAGLETPFLAGGSSADDLPFEADVESADGVWRLWMHVRQPMQMSQVVVTLSLDLASADALFLNGYNSWTDSVPRPVNAAMPGLSRTPAAIIRHWVLDASGDYRFAPQNPHRGCQHGEGYGYLRYGSEIVLFGECLPDDGVTTIEEDLQGGCFILRKEGRDRVLQPGERLCAFALCLCEAGSELNGGVESTHDATAANQAFASFMERMGKVRRPARPMVGFTSWYRHYGDIDQQKLLADLEGAARVLREDVPQGTPTVFQIDDGYTKVGDWLTPDATRFSQGMAHMAQSIRNAGLVPGLWIAPFVCEKDSALFARHPDWLLRDADGVPVMSGSHWSGGYALDTQNPQVRDYVGTVLQTATVRWGFRLLKLDFLYAAAMLPHAGLNRGQLMADALDLLRQNVPADVWFDLCGVPIMSAIGNAEYCRIGCDVGLDWDGAAYMRITGRERVSTHNALGNVRGRAHLDGIAFLNDPDVFFLRPDVRLTPAQRRELLSSDASCGSVLFTSDDMGRWDPDSRSAFRAACAILLQRADGKDCL